jgi:hypothetical protein
MLFYIKQRYTNSIDSQTGNVKTYSTLNFKRKYKLSSISFLPQTLNSIFSLA